MTGSQHHSKGLLIDTNLLVLLVVGSCNPLYIEEEKITSSYKKEDYNDLSKFIRPFRRFIGLPNILTETSNHLGKTSGPRKAEYFGELRGVIEALDEVYVPSRDAACLDHFEHYGLTDLAMKAEAIRSGLLLLTDDSRLADYLGRAGIVVADFRVVKQYLG